jgi:hypothetical protein
MSALLSLNQIPLVPWKGKTFNQIHSTIKKNDLSNYTLSGNRNYFAKGGQPLKIYRREIATTGTDACNARSSSSINEFSRPGGTVINTSSTNSDGLVNTVTPDIPNNKCETYESCSVVLSPSDSARRRVRSSGMINRKFKTTTDINNHTYYTSSGQYLNSRNKTFQQNQYNYFRRGDSTAKPGSALAKSNVYSANGFNNCKKYNISTAITFQYKWINHNDSILTYTVNVPAGDYSVGDLNTILHQSMLANQHYLIKGSGASNPNEIHSNNISWLLHFAINNNTNNIELYSYKVDANTFPSSEYTIPSNSNNVQMWSIPPNGAGLYPQLIVPNNQIASAIGFAAGTYPASNAATAEVFQLFTSTVTPGIQPLYSKLYYKPNNPQFANQGAVSSSDLITRKKYNSITNSSVNYRSSYGNATANALAYGVSEQSYTVKDKIGYPLNKTPVFPKYGDMKKCDVTSIRG